VLRERGVRFVGPATARSPKANPARAACPNRMDIVAALAGATGLSLAGARVVVSAGPTYDGPGSVRFIGNRSKRARWWGSRSPPPPARRGADNRAGRRPRASSDAARRAARRCAFRGADARCGDGRVARRVYVGRRPVADFTPRAVAADKIKKVAGQDTLGLELVRTPDILAAVAHDTRRRAWSSVSPRKPPGSPATPRDKLVRKRVDLIAPIASAVAGSGFESDDNALIVYAGEGTVALGPGPKTALAEDLLDLVEARLHA
jgi:phosphopantothenoylcysteine decarboxylase/phosphopantothenate--cysteine ligase